MGEKKDHTTKLSVIKKTRVGYYYHKDHTITLQSILCHLYLLNNGFISYLILSFCLFSFIKLDFLFKMNYK